MSDNVIYKNVDNPESGPAYDETVQIYSTGPGAVTSVNSQTGVVVLETDDITDVGNTNKYVTTAEKNQISTNQTNITSLQSTKADKSININTTAPLTGGGDLSANRTLNIDINTLSATTVASGDLIMVSDISDSNNNKKVTAQSIANLAAGAATWGAIIGNLEDQTDLKIQQSQFINMGNAYYFTSTASDVGGRLAMINSIPAGGGFGILNSAVVDTDVLADFLSLTGFPNVTSLPSGVMAVKLNVSQLSGTKVSKLYAEFYKRSLAGTDTTLATSNLSEVLTGTAEEARMEIPTGVINGLLTTDRIGVRIVASITGAGTDPDININIQGITYSRMSIPDYNIPVDLSGKQDIITASNRQLLWQNDSGIITGLDDYYINTLGGLDTFALLEPDNGGGESLHTINLGIEPLQDSPNQSYNFLQLSANSNNALFDYGINTRAITFQTNTFQHSNDKNMGEISFISNYFDVGNGTDAINVRGFSYNYGFGDIRNNVTITNAMQGFGFHPTFESGTTIDPGAYLTAFYDGTNGPNTSFSYYTSASLNPILGSIQNARNYTGISISPTIDDFLGNSGGTGIFIGGTIDTLDTGSYQGIAINPTINSGPSSVALSINTSSMNTTSVYAIDAIGDLNFQGDMTLNGNAQINGNLTSGKLSSFESTNPVDGGGNPQTVHNLTSQITALDSVTVANGDSISTANTTLVTLEDNSVTTSSAFGLGLAAVSSVMVVNTGTGSTLDFMACNVTALNLDGSSTGGTIDTVRLNSGIAIPNGVTTINNLRGYEFSVPFGDPGTITHAFYTAANVENYFRKSLVVGEDTEVAANSSTGLEISSTTKALLNARMTTTERDALTPLFGMQIANTSTNKLQFYDGSSWVDLH